jgi:hypothetical protein
MLARMGLARAFAEVRCEGRQQEQRLRSTLSTNYLIDVNLLLGLGGETAHDATMTSEMPAAHEHNHCSDHTATA